MNHGIAPGHNPISMPTHFVGKGWKLISSHLDPVDPNAQYFQPGYAWGRPQGWYPVDDRTSSYSAGSVYRIPAVSTLPEEQSAPELTLEALAKRLQMAEERILTLERRAWATTFRKLASDIHQLTCDHASHS